jgi:predicted dehydrogenase
MGNHHARVLRQLPACELVGVHDIDEERVEKVSQIHGTEGFSSLEALLDRADGVVIAVPTPDHHGVALRCLEAGCHVLVEKPLTPTLAEADEVIEAADAAGRVLQVGHIERYNPAVVALADLVQSPGFIEVDRLGSFAPRSLETDVILDLMIHDIDIVHSIVDAEVVEIRAVGVPILSDALDIANARLAFDNACIANLTASRVSANRIRKVRIFQPEAYLSVDYTDQRVDHFELVRQDGKPQGISARQVAVESAEPLVGEIEDFLASIAEGRQPRVDGVGARRSLATALQILAAIES